VKLSTGEIKIQFTCRLFNWPTTIVKTINPENVNAINLQAVQAKRKQEIKTKINCHSEPTTKVKQSTQKK